MRRVVAGGEPPHFFFWPREINMVYNEEEKAWCPLPEKGTFYRRGKLYGPPSKIYLSSGWMDLTE